MMTDKNVVPVETREVAYRPGRLFDPWNAFGGRIDSVLDDFFSARRSPALVREDAFLAPRVEVSETDEALTFQVELPGIPKDEVDVTIADDVLIISGEKRQEEERTEKDYHLTERVYGSFRRSFGLPPNVNTDKAEAKTDNGVLTISIPKVAAAKPKSKKVKIKTS